MPRRPLGGEGRVPVAAFLDAGAPGVAGRPRRCAGGPHCEPGPAGDRPSAEDGAHRRVTHRGHGADDLPGPSEGRARPSAAAAAFRQPERAPRAGRGGRTRSLASTPSVPAIRAPNAAGLATRSALEVAASRAVCPQEGRPNGTRRSTGDGGCDPGRSPAGSVACYSSGSPPAARRGPRGQDNCRTGLRVSRSASRPNHRPGHPRSANPPLCDRSSAGVEPCIGPSRTLKVRS